MNPTKLLHPEQRRPSKAYLVNELRRAIFTWREEGYPNVTNTSRRLLKFWFNKDHIVDGEPFEFWFCQKETIETLIYLYEVMKKRNFIDIARGFETELIKDSRELIDYWAIDWDYKGDTFHNQWQSFRVKKNPKFFIEYISEENLRRYYYPDFLVKLTNGEYWLIETKGLIDLEVAHKDKRAKQWCEDATSLTGNKWAFMRVDQEGFEKYRFKSVKEIISALKG